MKKLFCNFFSSIFLYLVLSNVFIVHADVPDFENFKPDQKPKELEVEALEKLLKTLESKSARKEFVTHLRTMIAAKTKIDKEPAPLALSKVQKPSTQFQKKS